MHSEVFIAYRLVPSKQGGYAITTAIAPYTWLSMKSWPFDVAMRLIQKYEELDKESIRFRVEQRLLRYIL